VGDRWTILILRDLFLGVRRFDELQDELGIARNVLAARLERMINDGILEKAPYQERPVRYEYRLTEKGIDLWPIVMELMRYGDRYAPAAGGPPTVVRHKRCGGALAAGQRCERCGAQLGARDVYAEPGPGAGADHPLSRRAARVSASAA
jgi:DNA-binding HxlR family transcriptional regulator